VLLKSAPVGHATAPQDRQGAADAAYVAAAPSHGAAALSGGDTALRRRHRQTAKRETERRTGGGCGALLDAARLAVAALFYGGAVVVGLRWAHTHLAMNFLAIKRVFGRRRAVLMRLGGRARRLGGNMTETEAEKVMRS